MRRRWLARLRGCGFFAGLAGFILLSTGFIRLFNIGPQKFCSWTASATIAVFAGRVGGLVLEPGLPAI